MENKGEDKPTSKSESFEGIELPCTFLIRKDLLFPFLENYLKQLFKELSDKSPYPENGIFHFIFREVIGISLIF